MPRLPGAVEQDASRQTVEPRVIGCGCMLPGAGLLLVALVVALVVLIGQRKGFGPSPWWLLALVLFAAIALLFGRFRARG